jgi:hypothetical protein
MDMLLAQIIGPDIPWPSRLLALVVLAAVAIFIFMATNSVESRADSPEAQLEARETERRAEAIVAAARREEAERIARGEPR